MQACCRNDHPHNEEQRDDAHQDHGNDENAAEGTGTETNSDSLLERSSRSRGHTNVGANRDPHANVTREGREDATDEERESDAKGQARSFYPWQVPGRSPGGVQQIYADQNHKRELEDHAVLSGQETSSTLSDCVGHLLHFLVALILR